MQQQTKILTKQTLLIASALIFCFVVPFLNIGDNLESGSNYMPLFVIAIPITVLMILLSVLYFMRLKKSNFKFLNYAFTIFSWVFIIFILLIFLMEVYGAFHVPSAGTNILQDIWRNITYRISWEYIASTNEYWSLVDDLKTLLYLIPYLIPIALFSWAVKTNKKLSIEKSST